MQTDALASIISGLSGAISEENKRFYASLVPDHMKKEADNIRAMSPRSFFHAFVNPFDDFIEGMVRTHIGDNNDLVFLYQNSQFVEWHFERLIEKIDGSACCADRSGTIMSALARSFSTGERIEFDYSQEYTFHLPKTVFKTHEEIMDFYAGIKNMFY